MREVRLIHKGSCWFLKKCRRRVFSSQGSWHDDGAAEPEDPNLLSCSSPQTPRILQIVDCARSFSEPASLAFAHHVTHGPE